MKIGKFDWLIAMVISVPLGLYVLALTGSLVLDVMAVVVVTIAIDVLLAVGRYQIEERR